MGGSLPPGFEHYNDIVYDIESRFTVKSLKALCGALGAPVSGAKGILQQRLRSLFVRTLNNNDTATFNIGKTTAEAERGVPYNAPRALSRPNGFHPGMSSAGTSSSQGNSWGMSSLYQNVRLPVFKKLPFYNLLTNVTQAYNIPACPTSRTTQPIHVRLTTEMISKLQPRAPQNPYRLVVFCTQTDRIPFGSCVVEFPAHAEIRCNGSIVSANLRGIKNKPGTVNPPDITPHSILTLGVTNRVDVTFAESKSGFTVTIYLVEKLTVQQLVEKIRKKGQIAKETTLNKMRAAQQDNDIVPGPETLTLKDPISMTRIDLPCKSRWCNHTACFDTATFMMLNEQTPTWVCPICNRSIPSEDDLYIDGYFADILQRTNKAVESVIVHPDGTWTNKDIDSDHPDAKLLNNQSATRPRLESEDRRLSSDRKLSFGPSKAEIVSLDDDDEDTGAPTPASLPPAPPRNASTSVRPSPGSSTPSRKRGPPQVVDLTLSDDDDDVPPARISRPAEQPAPKRVRVDRDPSISTDMNGVERMSMQMNRISPSSTIRPSHIRSPPSSISPRDVIRMFGYNQRPITLDSQTSFHPPGDYTIPANTLSKQLPSSNAFPSPLPVSSPTQSRPSLPGPSFLNPPYSQPTVSYSTASTSTGYPTSTRTNNDSNNINNTTIPRSASASPVLPAFEPTNPRPSTTFPSLDWDTDYPSTGAREWDPERDELDNEDLDLEMARLPSSMFDADAQQDWDGDY